MPQSAATKRKWTYADYLALPNDGKQHQIVGGKHFVTAAPRPRRQVVSANLFLLLATHVRRNDLGLVLYAPVDFVISETDVVQPDLTFLSKERQGLVGETHVATAPDLAIEILSPATRKLDLEQKRKLYQRHGVREYWIVDPDRETVRVLRRENDRYDTRETLKAEADDAIDSAVFPELKLPLREIFA